MKSLKADTLVYHSWYKSSTLPAGTKVVPATNIPEAGKYWIHSVPAELGLDLHSWVENYGILVDETEVTQ